jgi:hypothetical protein
VALRVGLPLAGAFVAAAAAPRHYGGIGDVPNVAYGEIAGGAVGATVAMLADSAALAWAPRDHDARQPREASGGVRLTPTARGVFLSYGAHF